MPHRPFTAWYNSFPQQPAWTRRVRRSHFNQHRLERSQPSQSSCLTNSSPENTHAASPPSQRDSKKATFSSERRRVNVFTLIFSRRRLTTLPPRDIPGCPRARKLSGWIWWWDLRVIFLRGGGVILGFVPLLWSIACVFSTFENPSLACFDGRHPCRFELCWLFLPLKLMFYDTQLWDWIWVSVEIMLYGLVSLLRETIHQPCRREFSLNIIECSVLHYLRITRFSEHFFSRNLLFNYFSFEFLYWILLLLECLPAWFMSIFTLLCFTFTQIYLHPHDINRNQFTPVSKGAWNTTQGACSWYCTSHSSLTREMNMTNRCVGEEVTRNQIWRARLCFPCLDLELVMDKQLVQRRYWDAIICLADEIDVFFWLDMFIMLLWVLCRCG